MRRIWYGFFESRDLFNAGADSLGCQRAPWYETLAVESATVGDVPNASRFGDRVIFGAQPTEADFTVLSEAGIRTVLNLRTEQEMADVPLTRKPPRIKPA
jgi:hypothetical protein